MTNLQIFIEVVIILLTIVGPLSYIWLTLHGTVVPHRLTYFFWFLVQAIAITASLAQGVAPISQSIVIISALMCILVFISSFYQRDKIVWKFTKFDWWCAALSVIGILLWQLTNIPNLAIVFAIIADFVITLPTLIKSYKAPDTESMTSYVPYLIAHVVNISFLINTYNFETLAMGVYLILNNVLIISFILVGKYKKLENISVK